MAAAPLPEEISTYSDAELKAIIVRAPVESGKDFPLDFNKVWPALGYTTKGNAVRALKRGTEGEDWIVVEQETVSGGVPEHKYWISEDFLIKMVMSAPNKELSEKFLSRYRAMEKEFKSMLLAKMASDESRKRVADIETHKLEVAERYSKLDNEHLGRVEQRLKLADFAKNVMMPLDDRDQVLFKDAIRNILTTITPPGSPPSDTNEAVPRPLSIKPPKVKELPLSEWLVENGYPRMNTAELKSLGKYVASAYRQHHNGESPPKRESYVGGAARPVNHYTTADKEVISEGFGLMKRFQRK